MNIDERLSRIEELLYKLTKVPSKSSYNKWTKEKMNFVEMHYLEGSSVLDVIIAMQEEFDDHRTISSIVYQFERIEGRIDRIETLCGGKKNAKWTPQEEQRVVDMQATGLSLEEMSQKLLEEFQHHRSHGAIKSRLSLLSVNKETIGDIYYA